MLRLFNRLGLMSQFAVLALLFGATILAATVVIARSLVVGQAVNQSRSVADMAEHIGTWGSRYGGVSVRLKGIDPAKVGTYLERHLYAPDHSDMQRLVGVQTATDKLDSDALKRLDAYYTKNPALIQREVADISAESPSGNKFRLTARSVFNQANAPNKFELRALDATQDGRSREYFEAVGDQLQYARSIVADVSCLRCHDSPKTAPGFMLTNATFSGGGGFGYAAGKPVAIISVYVKMPTTGRALAQSLSPMAWTALGAIFAVLLLLAAFTARRVIAPINRLRLYAEVLSNSSGIERNQIPDIGHIDGNSSNEIHRLTAAVAALGESVRILFRKARSKSAS